jgi:hypothetical protein
MGGVAAFPLLGHAFSMWYWFSFDAPGLGVGLEIILLGLLGLVAIASACFAAPRTAAVLAISGISLGVHLMLRGHPGLDSGPGPLVAAVAMAMLAVAQAFRRDVNWWSAIAGDRVLAPRTGAPAGARRGAGPVHRRGRPRRHDSVGQEL